MFLCLHVSSSLYFFVSMSLCFPVSLFLCLYVSFSLCFSVSMFLCLLSLCLFVFMFLCLYVSLSLCISVFLCFSVSFIQSFSFKDATIASKSSLTPKLKMRKIWWNIFTHNTTNSLLPTIPFVASGGFIGRRSRWSVYALL
jgi:hypothetical protein